jgi:hypothetical protein
LTRLTVSVAAPHPDEGLTVRKARSAVAVQHGCPAAAFTVDRRRTCCGVLIVAAVMPKFSTDRLSTNRAVLAPE